MAYPDAACRCNQGKTKEGNAPKGPWLMLVLVPAFSRHRTVTEGRGQHKTRVTKQEAWGATHAHALQARLQGAHHSHAQPNLCNMVVRPCTNSNTPDRTILRESAVMRSYRSCACGAAHTYNNPRRSAQLLYHVSTLLHLERQVLHTSAVVPHKAHPGNHLAHDQYTQQ